MILLFTIRSAGRSGLGAAHAFGLVLLRLRLPTPPGLVTWTFLIAVLGSRCVGYAFVLRFYWVRLIYLYVQLLPAVYLGCCLVQFGSTFVQVCHGYGFRFVRISLDLSDLFVLRSDFVR